MREEEEEEVQDTYLMLPSVEGRGLFSNTSTTCSCSFKRTVFASTSLKREKFSVADQKCNAAPSPQEGDKLSTIRNQGAQQGVASNRWSAVSLINSNGGVDAAAHPEYPVEVLFVHTEEVAVVLPQDDGGSTRWICDQGQLSKVVTLMERADHALMRAHTHTHTDFSKGAVEFNLNRLCDKQVRMWRESECVWMCLCTVAAEECAVWYCVLALTIF